MRRKKIRRRRKEAEPLTGFSACAPGRQGRGRRNGNAQTAAVPGREQGMAEPENGEALTADRKTRRQRCFGNGRQKHKTAAPFAAKATTYRRKKMQPGEVIRRTAFNTLDRLHGGRLNRLKEVNKAEIANGVTQEYQDRRIQDILAYAVRNCAFYGSLPVHEKLEDFPVQTKGDFLDHYEEILSDQYRDCRDKLERFSTSGSTGTPFTVLGDPEKAAHVYMNSMSVLELNGFRLGMKRGEFRAWIKGKNTISNWKSFKNNLIMIEISNMSDDAVKEILDSIKKQKIQALIAYSSAIQALTDYIDRTGYDISGWSVELIFTMGEALAEGYREKAERLFGIRPILSYGNNENGFVAVTLDGGDEYVVDQYNFYVEILKMDSDAPAEEGEMGRIVLTDYYNRAFPMIRYDTGDTGKMRTETDGQGRIHRYLTEIYGRRGSLIYNTKGEPLSIHVFMNNLLNFEGVLRQAKCIQTGKTTYLLQLNPCPGVKPDEKTVVDSYKKYLGQDADVQVEYIGTLPIQQSGKTMTCEQRCREYL